METISFAVAAMSCCARSKTRRTHGAREDTMKKLLEFSFRFPREPRAGDIDSLRPARAKPVRRKVMCGRPCAHFMGAEQKIFLESIRNQESG
jgi:hypothetical protein